MGQRGVAAAGSVSNAGHEPVGVKPNEACPGEDGPASRGMAGTKPAMTQRNHRVLA